MHRGISLHSCTCVWLGGGSWADTPAPAAGLVPSLPFWLKSMKKIRLTQMCSWKREGLTDPLKREADMLFRLHRKPACLETPPPTGPCTADLSFLEGRFEEQGRGVWVKNMTRTWQVGASPTITAHVNHLGCRVRLEPCTSNKSRVIPMLLVPEPRSEQQDLGQRTGVRGSARPEGSADRRCGQHARSWR